jgi:hypothetical protein
VFPIDKIIKLICGWPAECNQISPEKSRKEVNLDVINTPLHVVTKSRHSPILGVQTTTLAEGHHHAQAGK